MGCGSSSAASTDDPVTKIAKITGLKPAFVGMYHKRFYEECPNGEMTEKQFINMFMKIHEQTDNEILSKFLARVFLLFDLDKSGTVDFVEVIKILHMVVNGSGTTRLVLIFHLCDTDRSGTIEKEEFVGTIKDLVAFLPGDVTANVESLVSMASDAFSKMDKSGTGKLTAADYVQALVEDTLLVDHMIVLLLKALVTIVTGDPPIPALVKKD